MKPTYTCKICGAKVYPIKNKVAGQDRMLRTCEHDKAPVVADMKASCAGKGGIK
jgi:hypothetical protein